MMTNKELWAEGFPYDGPRDVPLGLIQGSGTWGLKFPYEVDEPEVEVLWEGEIETPYPRDAEPNFRLSPKLQYLRVGDRKAITVASHGWQPNRDPVEYMASQKIFWIFRNAGVKWIVGGGTCGILNNAILTGDLIVPNDFIDYTKRRIVSLPGTDLEFPMFTLLQRAKQAICPSIARTIKRAAKGLSFGRVHGYDRELIHAVTEGPRFETRAEVRRLRLQLNDTVGQSMVPEVDLARLCGMHIAFVYYGVNPAEGLLESQQWNLDELHETLRLDMARLHLRTLKLLPLDEKCGCMEYRVERPTEYKEGLS